MGALGTRLFRICCFSLAGAMRTDVVHEGPWTEQINSRYTSCRSYTCGM